MEDKIITVKVLHTKGCPASGPTYELIKKIAEELNIDIKLHDVEINTQEEAIKNRFLGSPTVQVNGKDIDPAVCDLNTFTLA